MRTDFTNKVVLVTGASVGIGESIALNFAKCGAKLVLVDRNVTCLQDVAKSCEKEKGLKPLQIIADLTEDDACETIARKTLDHFGRKFMERLTGLTEEEIKPLMKQHEPMIPMGKMCEGDDIARMVLHIASDNSRLVTGATVQVDGGSNLGRV